MGWELPLQQVSHPECKWVHRQELSDECKLALDIPREQSMSELLISVLWWASYDDPHNQWFWWHLWIDMVSVLGTPVVAMWDGEVITAKYRAWYGNSITIRHEFQWETIYSNYSHLSVMNVSSWQRVLQWTKIWEVWRSGFTMGPYGYHLDFQITTAQSPSHPYGYHDCEEWSYMEAVEQWLCREKLEKYTIDPLEFLAKYAWTDIRPIGWNKKQITQDEEDVDQSTIVWVDSEQVETVLWEQNQISSVPNAIVETIVENSTVSDSVAIQNPTFDSTIVIRQPSIDQSQPQEVIKEHDAAYSDQKNQWTVTLKPWFDVRWEVLWENAKVWNIVPVQFEITQDKEPVSGKLADRIRIEWPKEVELLPWTFGRIYKWKKTVFVRVKASWTHRLDVHSGELQLGQIVLTIE